LSPITVYYNSSWLDPEEDGATAQSWRNKASQGSIWKQRKGGKKYSD